jgi:hypothetical protein
MAPKPTSARPHAAFRPRSQRPLPAVEEGAPRLPDRRRPSLLAPRQLERRAPRQPQRMIRMRQRLLTRPVLVALRVRLVWRRGPSSAADQPGVPREGWVGMAPLQGSSPAIPTRLAVLPAGGRGQRLPAVCRRGPAHPPPPLPPPRWAPGWEACALIALVDGSPLEARRNKTQGGRARASCWAARGGGWGRPAATVRCGRALPQRPPPLPSAGRRQSRPPCPGGLLVVALGLCSVLGRDDWTDQPQGWGTRLRPKIA